MTEFVNETTHSADERRDLIRRLFAVAISLGIGSTIVSAKWLQKGDWPSWYDFEQIAIVLLALQATVLSWDGYLASVRHKPLNGRTRFTIDVFLVIIYMVLFVTSDKHWFWLPILCLIYALYVVWDAKSVLEYPQTFDKTHQASGRSAFSTMIRVFVCAAFDKPDVDRGPLISLIWTMYFVALWRIIWDVYPTFPVLPALIAGAAGLEFYRYDKRIRRGDVRGFTMWQRLSAIVLLLACVFGYAVARGIPRAILV